MSDEWRTTTPLGIEFEAMKQRAEKAERIVESLEHSVQVLNSLASATGTQLQQAEKERDEARAESSADKASLQMCGSRAQIAELERDQLREQLKIAKEVHDNAVKEFDRLQAENDQLRAENERLQMALKPKDYLNDYGVTTQRRCKRR